MRSSHKLHQLMMDVEELLAELSDEHSTEVVELRDRIEASLASTRRVVSDRKQEVRARVGQLAKSLDSYVTHYPRLAFVTGAVAAGFVGYIAGRSAAAAR
jgi:ElaB/YqjD/DUF883 family membrane-anchored ribosome-binding protein